MASSNILLFSIWGVAILFWARFIYLNALKNAERRGAFTNAIAKMLLYIPAGLQGILLFSYVLFKPFMAATFPQMIFGNLWGRHSEFVLQLLPSGVVLAGSLMLTLNLFLAAKVRTLTGTTGLLLKVIVFCAGAGLFLLLRINLAGDLASVSFLEQGIIYNSSLVLMLSLLIIVIFSLLKSERIRNRNSIFLKYFALASRMLLCYIGISGIVKFIFSMAFR